MLTPQQVAFYEAQGYLPLGKVLDKSKVVALQRRIDAIMMGKVVYDGMFFQIDSNSDVYELAESGYRGPTLDYRKIQDLGRDPLFLRYMQKPLFRAITRRLVAEDVSCFRAMFMNKPAMKGTTLPYHQDGGSQWELDRERFVTVWTALDPAFVDNGCVQIIPGSHKLGLLSERGHTLTPEQEAEYCSDGKSAYLEAEAGEAFLLHNYLLHRSGVNRTTQSRRAFSVVYMDAATRRTRDGSAFPVVFGKEALQPGPEPSMESS